MNLERLTERHRTRQFRCEHEPLNVYIRSHALKNDRANISRTHVVAEPGESQIMGYMTLANGSVAPALIPDAGPPNYSRGTVVLARLARDLRFKGQGVGPFLMQEAFGIVAKHAQQSGIFALEVIAKDDKAREFYERFGFERLLDDSLHLYLPTTRIPEEFLL